jgi:hypothetical protein
MSHWEIKRDAQERRPPSGASSSILKFLEKKQLQALVSTCQILKAISPYTEFKRTQSTRGNIPGFKDSKPGKGVLESLRDYCFGLTVPKAV